MLGERTVRSGRRRKLCDDAFERLECLLGEIAIEAGNLLGIRDEGLVGGLGELALRLERLVQRLHARELLDEGLGVLIGLLAIITISAGDRIDAALEVARAGKCLFDLHLAVLLHVLYL